MIKNSQKIFCSQNITEWFPDDSCVYSDVFDSFLIHLYEHVKRCFISDVSHFYSAHQSILIWKSVDPAAVMLYLGAASLFHKNKAHL